MSAIIQAVVLHCPTALVWNQSGEGKISSHLVGSPLDHLPIPPSALPMAPRFSNDHVRTCDLNSRITFFLISCHYNMTNLNRTVYSFILGPPDASRS